jgi:protein TonB
MNRLSQFLQLSFGFAVLLAGSVRAQAPTQAAPAGIEQRVYTYVERMPQLPGSGGGNRAVQEAIMQRLVIAKKDARACKGGKVLVQFTVDATGVVKDAHIERGLDNAACNEAVLAAARKLPAFSPGVQNGQKVAVFLTVSVPY